MDPSVPLPDEVETALLRAFEAPPAERREMIESVCARFREHEERIRDWVARKEELAEGVRALGDETAEIGRMIGPYKILEVLGEGGMGTVYLAEQKEPVRRRVALKEIKLGMDTKQVLIRFELERQALALMEHDNIAKVLDAGTTDSGRSYFVMELVRGIPITEYCDQHRLTVVERLDLFRQLCGGVAHAHQKGIIHRDLKPSNILVTVQGGAPVTKIIDFGLARATDNRLSQATLFTEEGRILGTPVYMSPEQAGLGRLDIDTRTDIYSLGVILYELLAGKLPFTISELYAAGMAEMQRMIREEDPPKPSTRVSTESREGSDAAQLRRTKPRALSKRLRGDLDWIIMRAMEKDRTRRYQSAGDFSRDLHRHMRNEPVEAGPPTAFYVLRKFARRYRGQVVAAALVLLALVAGMIGTVSYAHESDRNAKIASDNLQKVLDLSTIRIVKSLRQEAAEKLWPLHVDTLRPIREWLDRAGDLRGSRVKLKGQLTELRAEATSWMTADAKRWRHELLAQLVDELGAFLDGPDDPPGVWGIYGTSLPEVRRRQELIARVDGLTTNARAEWRRTMEEIARDPSYRGMGTLEQPFGVVPIGRDPDSGLFEFAHLLSGSRPRRDAAGCLSVSEQTGIVLVLVPPSSVRIGARKPRTDGEAGPNIDPHARDNECPKTGELPDVPLNAYFLSKYEVSQAQWKRITGTNPSRVSCDSPDYREHGINPMHPVENVSWSGAREAMHRIGLQLPTEAQWECAARAKTTTPRWTETDLSKVINLADVTSFKVIKPQYYTKGHEDGYAWHAPVNAMLANPLGFHHILGNVSELCEDPYDEKLRNPRRQKGSGLAIAPDDLTENYRAYRGGSHIDALYMQRVTTRWYYWAEKSFHTIGVRPAIWTSKSAH